MNLVTIYDIIIAISGGCVIVFTLLRTLESSRKEKIESQEDARVTKERQDTIISLHKLQRDLSESYANEITDLDKRHAEQILKQQKLIHELTQNQISSTSNGTNSLPKFQFSWCNESIKVARMTPVNFDGIETAFDVRGYFNVTAYDDELIILNPPTNGILETISFGPFNIGPGEPNVTTPLDFRTFGGTSLLISIQYYARNGQFSEQLIIVKLRENEWRQASNILHYKTKEGKAVKYKFVDPGFPVDKWKIVASW
jgi:hypothetical protein